MASATCCGRSPDLRASIAVRLTLWYAAAFAFSSLLAMALVYFTVTTVLHRRTDRELVSDADELVELVDSGGAASFDAEIARERAGPDSAVAHLRLWSREGEALASLGCLPPDSTTRRLVRGQAGRDAVTLASFPAAGGRERIRVAFAWSESGYVVELGQSLRELEALVGAMRTGILLVLPTVLLLGGPIGWFMARRALRGVEVVTRTALRIADGALDQRVPAGSRGDELDRLAHAFNRMLDQIAQLIAGMREMTDSLAHDLRTPLARIRATAERAAAPAAEAQEWRAMAATTTEECDRMLRILNSSLEIAEAEAGATPLARELVDLADLGAEACELFATLAEDAGVTLTVEPGEPCPVRADRGRLQRIVANLIDNAIKFTPAGGRVTVRVRQEGGSAVLVVDDSGVGIAADHLPRVFDRFYRVDGSRTGRGAGLGLSLARAFARAHGGDITVESAPAAGSAFTLRLKREQG